MKLFLLLWLVVCTRCQEKERTNSCEAQPTVNCICNQDGSQTITPKVQQNNSMAQGKPGKIGPPGMKGQKVEILIKILYP